VRRGVLIGFVVFAAACGSSSPHASAPPPSVATTASTVTSPTTTVPHDTATTVKNFCTYAHNLVVELNSQPTQFNSPAYNKRIDTAQVQGLKHAATIAPVALRGDFQIASGYFQREYNALAAVGFDGSKFDQSKDQPTAAERVAVTAIGQYLQSMCHVNGNTTS
jgi:hypothetical protein